MRRGVRWLVALGTIVATSLALVLPAQASTTIRGSCSFTWSPKTVTVGTGARVTWKSASCGPHTVTAWSSNWSKDTTLQTGQTTSRTFAKKGTFKYRCRFHSSLSGAVCSGMCGTVKVT
jgi:plastocyanin